MTVNDKSVFLFPGQGAQYQGMALDFYEADSSVRDLFAVASDVCGRDIQKLLAESDPDTLKRSDISQIAITIASLSAVRYLKTQGITPAACAGFSLGEYSALCTAGVLTEAETLTVVKRRGEIMQAVCEKLGAGAAPAGMSAVLGLDPDTVSTILTENAIPDLYGANYNSIKQTVLSGTAAALEKAAEIFKAAGARRVVQLAVAGPFHSPLMQDAAAQFEEVLNHTEFKTPVVPVYSNVTGKAMLGIDDIKQNALLHLTHPVLWTAEEKAIRDEIMPTVLFEVGPGTVLKGLWQVTGYEEPMYSAGKIEDFAEFNK